MLLKEKEKTILAKAVQIEEGKRAKSLKTMALAGKEKGTHSGYKELDGYKEMQMDPHIFHHWGQEEGYDCWDNDNFKKRMCKNIPGAKVKYVSPKTTVSFSHIDQDHWDEIFGKKNKQKVS